MGKIQLGKIKFGKIKFGKIQFGQIQFRKICWCWKCILLHTVHNFTQGILFHTKCVILNTECILLHIHTESNLHTGNNSTHSFYVPCKKYGNLCCHVARQFLLQCYAILSASVKKDKCHVCLTSASSWSLIIIIISSTLATIILIIMSIIINSITKRESCNWYNCQEWQGLGTSILPRMAHHWPTIAPPVIVLLPFQCAAAAMS